MIRPHVYSVADSGYNRTYAQAFLNSAGAHGHTAEMFSDGQTARNLADKARYTGWRFQLMPQLVARHEGVLLVDVDSVFLKPLDIEPEYDLGLFLRPWKTHEYHRAFGAIVYCRPSAMEFACAMAKAMSGPINWYDDQRALWRLYQEIGHKFRVKQFDRTHIDWDTTSACIYTGKGVRKDSAEFVNTVKLWNERIPIAC